MAAAVSLWKIYKQRKEGKRTGEEKSLLLAEGRGKKKMNYEATLWPCVWREPLEHLRVWAVPIFHLQTWPCFNVLDSPPARVGTFYFSTHMHLQDSRVAETTPWTPKNRGTEDKEWVFVGLALMSLLQPLADSALSVPRCLCWSCFYKEWEHVLRGERREKRQRSYSGTKRSLTPLSDCS